MKNTWIILRIVLSLVAIFALGIWIGRTTAPDIVLSPTDSALESEADLSTKGSGRVTRRAMERYQKELELSNEQMDLLRPAFENVTLRMIVLPKTSRARMAVVEDFHDEIAPHLTPEQQKKAGGILEVMASRKHN